MNNPRLKFYHPNRKNTGAALALELVPATDETISGGCIKWRIIPQEKAIEAPGVLGSTFDWLRGASVDLHVEELAKVLEVLRGYRESIDDGKGIFVNEDGRSVVFRLSHRVEPVCGFVVEMLTRENTMCDDHSFAYVDRSFSFVLTTSEAIALECVISSSLARVVFG